MTGELKSAIERLYQTFAIYPCKPTTATVNNRRKDIGIIQTVDEMAEQSDIIYKEYSLDDIKKLEGESPAL